MKKSLLAIVFAAATLPLTFAQAPAPSQPAPDQKSTTPAKPAKKGNKKHSTKKTTGSSTSTPTNPPQK